MSTSSSDRDAERRRFLLELTDARTAMRQVLLMLELQRSKLPAAVAQEVRVIEQRVIDTVVKLLELEERAQSMIFDAVVEEMKQEQAEAQASGPHLH